MSPALLRGLPDPAGPCREIAVVIVGGILGCIGPPMARASLSGL
jgi:hypothetical protein